MTLGEHGSFRGSWRNDSDTRYWHCFGDHGVTHIGGLSAEIAVFRLDIEGPTAAFLRGFDAALFARACCLHGLAI